MASRRRQPQEQTSARRWLGAHWWIYAGAAAAALVIGLAIVMMQANS